MEFQDITIVVAGLIIILQQFYIHKSIPMDKVAPLLGQLRPLVEKTETEVDDFLLDTAEDLADRVKGMAIGSPIVPESTDGKKSALIDAINNQAKRTGAKQS